ncbi:hypothetical protein L6164_026382 [Bauhinia variegata]|uniref:Uncharacterized protein n=1 Tax=Bauhinia variegata TaxID=167791 RepID=A0ACB9LPY4_BAUVA|nr:hypothetical protein L6164_026382 [Bauhinia variegata]
MAKSSIAIAIFMVLFIIATDMYRNSEAREGGVTHWHCSSDFECRTTDCPGGVRRRCIDTWCKCPNLRPKSFTTPTDSKEVP